MYFVTIKHPDYVLFSMTPSERAAVALTEAQAVHLLLRDGAGGWRVRHRWEVARFSHTEFMALMHQRDEPADPEELLQLLPPELR